MNRNMSPWNWPLLAVSMLTASAAGCEEEALLEDVRGVNLRQDRRQVCFGLNPIHQIVTTLGGGAQKGDPAVDCIGMEELHAIPGRLILPEQGDEQRRRAAPHCGLRVVEVVLAGLGETVLPPDISPARRQERSGHDDRQKEVDAFHGMVNVD